MAKKMTIKEALSLGMDAEMVKKLQAAGLVESPRAAKKGMVELKVYAPKNNDKGTGVYLVVGPYGSQLFTRLNDGEELTDEGRAKAESIVKDIQAVLDAGFVSPPRR